MDELLFFNWVLEDEKIEESYPKKMSGDFDISDYYFESHSIIALSKYYAICQMDFVDSRKREHLKRLLKKVLEVDDSFQYVVDNYKHYFLDLQKKLGSNFQRELEETVKSYQRDEISRADYYQKINFLKKTIVLFFKENNHMLLLCRNFKENYEKIISIIKNAFGNIQEKVNKVVALASKIWNLKLFDFSQQLNQSLVSTQKLNALLESYDEVLENLHLLSVGQKKYTDEKKGGCVAVCFIDETRCFALSGIDYDPQKNAWAKLDQIIDKDIIKMGKIIEQKCKLSYCQLNEFVKRYTTETSDDIYFNGEEKRLKEDVIILSEDELKCHYACCERKIKSIYPTESDYLFFIKYLPCKKCLPAVVSNAEQNITIYTRFNRLGFGNGRSEMIKTKVIEKKKLELYCLTESYFVGDSCNCE
ncbi:hypothetical protein IKQ19_15645 [Candidatus Saccharibacteria bacterium]|nr:hypothetical protein [Candidatus Saccharibacteria bacterium]